MPCYSTMILCAPTTLYNSNEMSKHFIPIRNETNLWQVKTLDKIYVYLTQRKFHETDPRQKSALLYPTSAPAFVVNCCIKPLGINDPLKSEGYLHDLLAMGIMHMHF